MCIRDRPIIARLCRTIMHGISPESSREAAFTRGGKCFMRESIKEVERRYRAKTAVSHVNYVIVKKRFCRTEGVSYAGNIDSYVEIQNTRHALRRSSPRPPLDRQAPSPSRRGESVRCTHNNRAPRSDRQSQQHDGRLLPNRLLCCSARDR